MVAQDLGIGFVPLRSVRDELAQGKLVTIRVEGVRNEWNLWLVHRKGHSLSPAARTLLDVSLAITRPSDDDPGTAFGGHTVVASERTRGRHLPFIRGESFTVEMSGRK